jgi:predicted nucleotidyltransferase
MHFKLPKTGSVSDEVGTAGMEIADGPVCCEQSPTAVHLSRGKTPMTRQEAVEILSRNKMLLSDFRVNALYLFGSVVRDEAGPESDIDILVEFNQDARVGLFELARLRAFISEILGCNVDLVTPDALHPLLKDGIMGEVVRAAYGLENAHTRYAQSRRSRPTLHSGDDFPGLRRRSKDRGRGGPQSYHHRGSSRSCAR